MAAAAYTRLARQLELPDLLTEADAIRDLMAAPGWRFLEASVAEQESKMLAQLLNETTRVEEIPRLRGLVAGLKSMREAAEAILALADEREAEARREAQEKAHA